MPIRTSLSKLPLLVTLAFALPAVGQTYPSGPMSIVVPFPPGGGTDILARSIAQKLNESWGQPVIVENRAGANGVIGTAYVARAAPDGHTMLIVPGGIAVNPFIRKNLPYDTLKDLTAVTQLGASPLVLAVHPSFPPRNVKELIALLKARPGEVNFGTSGNGSPPHLAAELFKVLSGTKMNHIPYRGAGPAAIDLISGQIALYFMNALQVVPHVRAGQVRALGLTSTTRSTALPEVPTIAEAGLPGYDLTHWYGLFVRAGTPVASVTRLQSEMARILRLPEVEKRLTQEGATIVASTPDQFLVFLTAEMKKAQRIVQASGMTAAD